MFIKKLITIFCFIVLTSNVFAVTVNIEGEVKNYITHKRSGVYNLPFDAHTTSFKTTEPFDCQGVTTSNVVYFNPISGFTTGELDSMDLANLAKALPSFYTSAGLTLELSPKGSKLDNGEYVCIANLTKAIKDTSLLQNSIDNIATVKEIKYSNIINTHIDNYKHQYHNYIEFHIKGQMNCQGMETDSLIYHFYTDDNVTSYEIGNYNGRDLIIMAALNNYVSVSKGEYYTDDRLGVVGCLITDMRTLNAEERILVDDQETNSCDDLYSSEELDSAIANALNQGVLDGIQMSQNAPHDYGLYDNNDLMNYYDLGKSDCQNNPASCGLYSESDLNKSYQNGIQSCIDDPASCNLYNEQNIDEITSAMINAIIADLPKGQIVSICHKNPSSLLCKN